MVTETHLATQQIRLQQWAEMVRLPIVYIFLYE